MGEKRRGGWRDGATEIGHRENARGHAEHLAVVQAHPAPIRTNLPFLLLGATRRRHLVLL